MRIRPGLSWLLESTLPEALDARLLPLLEAIATGSSLSAAVSKCGVSYRAAWGLLREYERKLGAPLVQLHRGRGARLALAGERLVAADRAAHVRLARILPRLSVDIGEREPRRGRTPTLRLRVAASHDLALLALRDALRSTGLEIELAFMGSLLALQQFDEGRVDAAGFHVVDGLHGKDELRPFMRYLRAKRDRLLRVVDREQGLILPRGNPARVKSFGDIARKGLRFVNRQQGSGTRLIVERILEQEGIAAGSLAGYASEEFTHPAVAATVASGAADAGFGLRAAAREHGLAFVAQARERYYLAFRAAASATPPVTRLLEALDSPVFARIVRGLPGYAREGAVALARVDTLIA